MNYSKFQNIIICPICKSRLSKVTDNEIKCGNKECETIFPIVNNIPILINEENSLFSINNFMNCEYTTFKPRSNLRENFVKYLPKISSNIKTDENFQLVKSNLLKNVEKPKVLVVGGSIVGNGMESMYDPSIELIETDVSFGPQTKIICDCHDLPFKDTSLDCVIIQAVLEHVLDPQKCVDEIFRVLKKDGLVYAETPFMQQVHMGKYDFTRFSYLGHRNLFKKFKETSSGLVGGPGMALAWSYQYFLLSFVTSIKAREFIQVFARFTSFWLKYVDLYLYNKPGSLDAAAGYYFIGYKHNEILKGKDLIKLYKGTQ